MIDIQDRKIAML